MHKYNYTYKITNIKTKEFYVGVRSCDCEIECDKYMGSSSIWTKLYIKEHKDDLTNSRMDRKKKNVWRKKWNVWKTSYRRN